MSAAPPAPRGLDLLAEDERSALLAAAPNFRDVGGQPAGGGRSLRPGVAFRTGQLVGLSAPAQAALTSLGIVRVYDLRTDAERAPLPDTLPAGVALVVADVLADDPGSGATRLASLGHGAGGPVSVEAVDALITGGRARTLMIETYRDFVRLGSADRAYRSFVTGVIDSTGPLAFHCTAGKDRTGWAAAVLQMFAGMDESAVMADYLESNHRTAEVYGAVVEAFGRAGGDAESLADLVNVCEDYLDAGLTALRQRYGDVEHYLATGLGLSSSDLEALADRLIG